MNEFLDMQILRTRLAAQPPGSEERFTLIRHAKNDHRLGILFRESVAHDDEIIDRDVAERQWIAEVSSFAPADPYRLTVPAGMDLTAITAQQLVLRAVPDWHRTIPTMLSDPSIWQDGGDLLMHTLIDTMLGRDFHEVLDGQVWMHVLGCRTKHPDKNRPHRHLPDIEHAWRLLDVAMGLYRLRSADHDTWVKAHGWFTPNTLGRIMNCSGSNVPCLPTLDRPMQALLRRYVDHHYDLALSNLLATAQRKPDKRKLRRVRRGLRSLLWQAHRSIDHLERWTMVRDHLVAMGITTVPRANGMVLCYVLGAPRLHEDDAMRWTLRLLREGLDQDIALSTLVHAVRAAAESGWTDIVDVLIDHGADLSGDCGTEALLGAMTCEHHAMVEHLLNRGVRIRDVHAYLDSDRFPGAEFDNMDRDHVRAVLRAWETKALNHEVEVLIADLPVQRAAERRRL